MPLEMRQAKKGPLPVFRRPSLEEDPMQLLWAVSYCDLLMVLLCFFILFFQDTSTPAISNLILTLQDQTKPVPAEGPTATGDAAAPKSTIESVGKALQVANISAQTTPVGRTIQVDFEPNLYAPRKFEFPKRKRAELDRLLEVLRPYANRISLRVVGHADEAPLSKKNNVIDSNLVLSTLRGSRATEYVLQQGFDPRHTTAEGAGSSNRKTRSLSIIITERDAQ